MARAGLPLQRLRGVLERAGWVHLPEPDAASRREFEADGLARCRWGATLLCWFATALLVASAAQSYFAEPEVFLALLRIRAASLGGLVGILLLVRSSYGTRRSRELMLAFVLLMAVTMHALALAVATGGQASPQYDRMNFLVLGTAVFATWSAGWSLLACASVLGVFLAGAFAAAGALFVPPFEQNLGRLAAASVVTVSAAAIRERRRWRDVTARLELAAARAQERERRRRYELLVDTAGSAIIALGPHGRIVECNRAAEALYGWRRANVLDTDYLAHVPDDRRAATAEMLVRVLAGDAVSGWESSVQGRDGGCRFVVWNLNRIDGANGQVLGVIAVGQDITERRLAEQEVRLLNEELEQRVLARTAALRASEEQARQHQAQLAHVLRVGTMGEMAAQLAHELNQPLGAMVNFANGIAARLRERGVEAKALREAARQIAAEGLRAGEIIRRVREFIRRGEARREVYDVNQLVRDAVQLIEPDARRQTVPVRLALDPALPPVPVDPVQIEQVILNLLRNGLEAIAAAEPGAHEVAVETATGPHGTAEVRVRDTGVGLPPEAGERIFDPFFTTKAGGLGMGLSNSRSIVEAHGGRLRACAGAGGGTIVSFTLPAPEGVRSAA